MKPKLTIKIEHAIIDGSTPKVRKNLYHLLKAARNLADDIEVEAIILNTQYTTIKNFKNINANSWNKGEVMFAKWCKKMLDDDKSIVISTKQ